LPPIHTLFPYTTLFRSHLLHLRGQGRTGRVDHFARAGLDRFRSGIAGAIHAVTSMPVLPPRERAMWRPIRSSPAGGSIDRTLSAGHPPRRLSPPALGVVAC